MCSIRMGWSSWVLSCLWLQMEIPFSTHLFDFLLESMSWCIVGWIELRYLFYTHSNYLKLSKFIRDSLCKKKYKSALWKLLRFYTLSQKVSTVSEKRLFSVHNWIFHLHDQSQWFSCTACRDVEDRTKLSREIFRSRFPVRFCRDFFS